MSTISTTTIKTTKLPKQRPYTKVEMEASIRRKNKRKTKRSQRKPRDLALTVMPQLTADYINSLNDPFEYGPCRLGFGTLVPTNLYTGYFRSTLALNADGSGAVVLMPAIGSLSGSLFVNNSGAAGTTWTIGSGFTDATAISNSASEARVVSLGLRAIPQVAATAVPGIISCGQLTSAVTNTLVESLSPNALQSQPQLRVGFGALGGTACGRPIDPVSYQFLKSTIQGDSGGATGTIVYNFGCPTIVFTGFAASTNVFVEGVINIETLLPSSYGATTAMEQSGSSQETVSDNHPSIESMWRKIQKHVTAPGVVDHIGDLATKYGRAAANTMMNRYFNSVSNDLVIIDAD